jgi:cytochrome c biogenesis protein
MTQAVFSLSDAQFYPAPMVFMLQDFKQVQASVFQVARAPARTLSTWAASSDLGVFAMLYVRDRRLWVWLAPAGRAAMPRWPCPPTARPWTPTASSPNWLRS